MWDKIFGYVGLPVLLDLLNKLGIGGAAKEAISELKDHGEIFYLTNKRRVALFSIQPLRTLHIAACAIHAMILIAAWLMVRSSGGQDSQYLYLIALAVSSLIHLGVVYQLPYPVKYKKDDLGNCVLFPDTHGLAGQKMLDDTDPNYKVDLEKVSLVWSINLTTFAGFVSSIALLLLCKATGNQGFLFLSIFTGILSAASLEIFIQIFNWMLVKVVRMVEGSASFIFAQAAILFPHITAESVDKHAADSLFPEQKFLPLYIRIRDLCFEVYLFFVLALMLSPTPEMFGWVASSLLLIGVISHLMIKSGQSAPVIARRQSFLNLLFVLIIPAAIAQSFFRIFFPELAVSIQSNIGSIITSAFGFLGFVAHPCEHITTGKPLRFLFVAVALGYIASRLLSSWKKELKEKDSNPFAHRVILIGGAFLIFVTSFISLGTGAGALINFTGSGICAADPIKVPSKEAPVVVESQKTAEVESAPQEAPAVVPVEPEVSPVTNVEQAQLQVNVEKLSQKVASQQLPATAPQGRPDTNPPSEPASTVDDGPSPEFLKLTENLQKIAKAPKR